MGRLIVETQVSLDGYMDAADPGLDWLVWSWGDEWTWDDALRRHHEDLLGSCGVTLLSSSSDDEDSFIDHWAAVASDVDHPQAGFARSITDSEKVLFSRSGPRSARHDRTRFADRPLAEEVQALKRDAGTDLIAYGGVGLVHSLLAEGLVDELHLVVNPIALGEGSPIFPTAGAPHRFAPVSVRSFECGVTVLHLQAAR